MSNTKLENRYCSNCKFYAARQNSTAADCKHPMAKDRVTGRYVGRSCESMQDYGPCGLYGDLYSEKENQLSNL